MAYRDFTTLSMLQKTFDVEHEVTSIFPSMLPPLKESAWLKQTLIQYSKLPNKSEKARSELFVMPILADICAQNNHWITIYSGERLVADKSRGLNGECDFIIAQNKKSFEITAPIMALVEAKRDDITPAIPQCAAQMIGANIFNRMTDEGKKELPIYGCVTTAHNWRFLKLEHNRLYIDENIYYLRDLEKILSIFQYIIDVYQKKAT